MLIKSNRKRKTAVNYGYFETYHIPTNGKQSKQTNIRNRPFDEMSRHVYSTKSDVIPFNVKA